MAKRETANTISKEELEKASVALAASDAREKEKEAVEAEAKAKKKAEKVVAAASAKSQKGKKRGANYIKARKLIDKNKTYPTLDAVKLIKSAKFAKFDESIELHISLGIDPKNTDQRVRFTTSLPFGTGKSVNILVISEEKASDLKNVIYKSATAIDEIVSGKLVTGKDFDIVLTKPEFMKDIAKVAKILGPKGIMPNPKNGTVTSDVDKTLKDLAKGQVEIKNQNGHAVLHTIVGNMTFKDEEISENVNFILSQLNKNQPAKLKKKFVMKAYIASSMSPSVRIAV